MAKMIKDNQALEISEIIITRNYWEYYVIGPRTEDIFTALVLGDETEIGDVSYSEIRPYILTKTPDDWSTNDAFPATGWQWAD